MKVLKSIVLTFYATKIVTTKKYTRRGFSEIKKMFSPDSCRCYRESAVPSFDAGYGDRKYPLSHRDLLSVESNLCFRGYGCCEWDDLYRYDDISGAGYVAFRNDGSVHSMDDGT